MDKFARLPAADRRPFIEESAARRDLTPTIIEKDFWVCWTLRRLAKAKDIGRHLTFKGGTVDRRWSGPLPFCDLSS